VHAHLTDGRSPAGGEDPLVSAPTGRSRKPSQHISKRQATNLIAAFEFAEAMGVPLNVSVDIAWIFFSGNTEDRTRFARCQQRLSKWACRHGFPLTMIWTREIGKYGSPHTHVLLHVPPIYIHDKAILIQPAYRPLGKLLYNLKGVVPRDAKEFGIRATYQGILSGKRAGFTQNLGPGARRKAPIREVAPPSSRTSEKALSIWTIGAKYEPITCCEQTPASKFNSWDTHEAAPARDRQNGTDARNIEWLEPPDEVVAAAIKLYKSDTRGRWNVRAPDAARLRIGPYAWAISHADVTLLLRRIWPKYLAKLKLTQQTVLRGTERSWK